MEKGTRLKVFKIHLLLHRQDCLYHATLHIVLALHLSSLYFSFQNTSPKEPKLRMIRRSNNNRLSAPSPKSYKMVFFYDAIHGLLNEFHLIGDRGSVCLRTRTLTIKLSIKQTSRCSFSFLRLELL